MSDPVQQLHEIPDLAVEVLLTWGAKNPTEAPLVAAKREYPQAPADLEALDCLRSDELGLLFRLTQCVRATAETLRDDGLPWPEIKNPPTWTGECAWLLGTADTWRHDLWLFEYVTEEVDAVWQDLAQAARLPRSQKLICPQEGCSERVHHEGGQAWRCEAGHPISLDAEARQAVPIPLKDAAKQIGKTRRTLQRWIEAGKLKPAGLDGKAQLVRMRDVRALVVGDRETAC